MRSKLIPSVLWTSVVLFPTGLLAQNAQLSGFVSDASEGRVPKANLTITNDDTGAKRTTNHRYQELCQELITNGTEESRLAAAIAGEPMNTGARIRSHLPQT